MAQLHIVLGPMFSGKSTYLINKSRELLNGNYDGNGISSDEILIINHIFDTRYSKNCICTHDGVNIPSLSIMNLNDLYTEKSVNFDKIKYIFIDEGQFFNDLFEIVKSLLIKHNKIIYIGGLDGDYKQEPFDKSRLLELIPFANTVIKLNARCSVCNNSAPFTKRLTISNEQILVGGSGEYQPVCLNHLL